MDSFEQREQRRKPKTTRARDRQEARQRKREGVATPRAVLRENASTSVESARSAQVLLWLSDVVWTVTHRPRIWQGMLAVGGILFALFAVSHVFTGRLFPNVWSLGIHLGDLTTDEAVAALNAAWHEDLRINLMIDGQTLVSAAPAELGLQLDAAATATAAKNIGMSGIPFGYIIDPVVSFRYATGETYLLQLTDEINTLPYNAGYTLQAGEVVGIRGRDGRYLDIPLSLEQLNNTPLEVIARRRMNLLTTPIPPDVIDPAPYLEQVAALTRQPFQLIGYDAVEDVTTTWATTPENAVVWFEAGVTGLSLRNDTFRPFINALNESIADQDPTHYISIEDAAEQIQIAIDEGIPQAYLRLRTYPQPYTVQSGDTAYSISRRTGIPFFLIADLNEGRDLGQLFVGDEIMIPSVDEVIPEPPVPNKRIIVNLDDQSLVAFEDGQEVFAWDISSGVSQYPTSPGIYQILDHQDVAYGSSFTLCSNDVCGQWTMYWFMSIYEVSPGLMNGFHGAVELPNGAYLGGGSVGQPYTFGCVMSQDDNARLLYEWAETGTVVEIISREFMPRSELARRVYSRNT